MRAIISCLVTTFAITAAAAAQDVPDKPRTMPKKGDTVSVRGCLVGSALEATEFDSRDAADTLSRGLTFQLRGSKNALKQMRDKYHGKLVTVEGVLKSHLPQDNVQSRKVGKFRITVGSPSGSPGSPQAETSRSLPVLEVTSFEGSSTTCAR